MIGQEIKEELKVVNVDVTPKKVEEQKTTPEQRMQDLATEMFKATSEGKDPYDWIEASESTLKEKINLCKYVGQLTAQNAANRAAKEVSASFCAELNKIRNHCERITISYSNLE